MIFCYLINDKVSLKQQLLAIYAVISVLSCGITLAIGYGIVYAFEHNVANNVLIEQNAKDNLQSLAAEIANTINQEIVTVGEAICLTTSERASILLLDGSESAALKFVRFGFLC